MAVDKVIDSGKLDACCEAEAAAIIAKGGGTAPLAYDFANNKGFADAIASILTGGSAVTGTFTQVARSAGFKIMHNANLSDYVLICQMQKASFEELRIKTGVTEGYSIAFIFVCTDKFYDFVADKTVKMNKLSVRWNYSPNSDTLNGPSAATNPIQDYTPNAVEIKPTWGIHAGTYDFWAIPLNGGGA